ncbi:unnamed protein product [Oncorhynchus mykiss]|uniref:C2H2-type domain-containing protein n=1 Tax=Oncorhynchus mykiss TaxID=8022 RepID=A0A060YM00_ONCMY|nr:unnamed protein product [Oncorhynchus mykiss]
MLPPKHNPAKPHCFLTHCPLNPESNSTNVSTSQCACARPPHRVARARWDKDISAGQTLFYPGHRWANCLTVAAGCNTARDRTQICSGASSTAMQCLRPLRHSDLQQLIVSKEAVPPEQQHCEKEWSPNLGQEVKEEQEELRTSQVEKQLQGLEEEFIFSPAFVKSHYDQVSSWTSHFPSTSNEQINTDSDGEDYRLFEPTSDSQTLAAVNLHCSVANSMGSLVCHMKMHAKDADDSGVCEKNVDSTESMQDHLQTHIDTRFSCDVCSKCFTMSSKLKMHMRCHRRNLLHALFVVNIPTVQLI